MNYYDLGLCTGLANANVAVTLHTCDINPPKSPLGLFGVRRTFTGVYGADPKWQRGLRYVRGLVRCMLTERLSGASVAHFHFFHIGALEYASVVLARLLRFRVVITAHDVESFKQQLSIAPLVKRAYAKAAAVIVHNATSAVELHAKFALPKSRIWTIPHGNYLDFVATKPPLAAARQQLGLPGSGAPVVLFFGQIKEVKGLDVLIRAFAILREHGVDATLVIAGRPWKDDFSTYQQQIESLALQHHVSLHLRYIFDDEVAAFYAAADVIVLPYRKIYQSGVLLMAMSYGTPVIASDLPAMQDVIEHRRNGLLFRNNDAEHLATTLRQGLGNRKLLAGISAAALVTMRTHHGWDGIGLQTARAYGDASTAP